MTFFKFFFGKSSINLDLKVRNWQSYVGVASGVFISCENLKLAVLKGVLSGHHRVLQILAPNMSAHVYF